MAEDFVKRRAEEHCLLEGNYALICVYVNCFYAAAVMSKYISPTCVFSFFTFRICGWGVSTGKAFSHTFQLGMFCYELVRYLIGPVLWPTCCSKRLTSRRK